MSPIHRSSTLLAPGVAAVGLAGPNIVCPPRRPRARSRRRSIAVVFAALSLAATALVLLSTPPAATAAAQRRLLYAYANGGSSVPGCPAREGLLRGCSLGDALSQARGGDTVALATPGRDGHYVGNWEVRTGSTSALEPLRIAPAPGVADPLLDGNHGEAKGCGTRYCSGAVLVIGPHVHLDMSGLTIEGALDRASPAGGGVRNDLGGNLSVSGCTFYDDQASWGGAIDNADANGTGTLVVTTSTFRDDEAPHGGAINNHGRASVSGSVFSGNRSTNGGAIDNGDGGRLVVASSSFSANSALDDGGAIDNERLLAQGAEPHRLTVALPAQLWALATLTARGRDLALSAWVAELINANVAGPSPAPGSPGPRSRPTARARPRAIKAGAVRPEGGDEGSGEAWVGTGAAPPPPAPGPAPAPQPARRARGAGKAGSGRGSGSCESLGGGAGGAGQGGRAGQGCPGARAYGR
jgi:hypothetical protein